MIEISESKAKVIGFIATVFFAWILWWYALEGTTNTSIFMVIGIIMLFLNFLALWGLYMSTTKKKRGKK